MKKLNDQPLKAVLKEMVEVYRLKGKLNQTRIQSSWAQLMGQAIARYTTEIKLRNGKLFLTISSSALKQELSFGKDKIKKIINEELGEETVQEIVIR